MERTLLPLSISIVTVAILGLTICLGDQDSISNISIVFGQTEWKTYLNPVYKFSFDYPDSNVTSIKETANYDVIVGDSDSAEFLFRLELISKNNTQDYRSLVEEYKKSILGYRDPNFSLFEDIKSISYPQVNLTGYEYVVFSKDSDSMTREIFLTNDQLEYIMFFNSGLSRYNYSTDTWIDKTINSLKFFR
jgi:hypothetical protein